MEIYMYFLLQKKDNIFLNYYFSLGVYLSRVLNDPGSIASCQAISCQLGLPLLAHLYVL